MNKLSKLRNDYRKSALDESLLPPDPLDFLSEWLNDAIEAEIQEPNAMVLSTHSQDGFPSSRVVLLKGMENGNLIFFTNQLSVKGQEIKANPLVGLLFFWPELERQVRIKGTASRIPDQESDLYFASRPRNSQIGAWASEQSKVILSREWLEKEFLLRKKEWKGRKVLRPPYWGGYAVAPLSIEFWQGRPGRLHDRIFCEQTGAGWKISRLSP